MDAPLIFPLWSCSLPCSWVSFGLHPDPVRAGWKPPVAGNSYSRLGAVRRKRLNSAVTQQREQRVFHGALSCKVSSRHGFHHPERQLTALSHPSGRRSITGWISLAQLPRVKVCFVSSSPAPLASPLGNGISTTAISWPWLSNKAEILGF